MQDQFGREITYLRLSVTELCNLRCRYCMPEEGVCKRRHDEMLTEEEMVQAIQAAAALGIWKVRITGGEPLVKPNVLSICQKTAAVPGIREVCLTTNGTLLPQMADALRRAGVDRVNLSLDTLNPQKYLRLTRRDELPAALRGLEAALAAGFKRVKINTVLIGGFNDDEIVPLAELTRRYPVDLRFIELMPMAEDGFGPEAYLSADAVLACLPDAVPVPGDGVAQCYRLPGAQGNLGLIRPVSSHFCGSCNRIRVTADGFVKPCLHGGQEYPIKGMNLEQMKAQLRCAIAGKPECHGQLSAEVHSSAGRTMNRIGG